MPVLSFVLTKMGLLSPAFLIGKFKYAVVLIFVVAAVLTPPDVVSQLVLGIPLMGLYGISILVSYVVSSRQSRTATPVALREQEGAGRKTIE